MRLLVFMMTYATLTLAARAQEDPGGHSEVEACLAGEECPVYLEATLVSLATVCMAFGGELKSNGRRATWRIDLGGSVGYLVDPMAVVCSGAPGAIACGHQDCAKILYGKRGNSWETLATLHVEEPCSMTVSDGGELTYRNGSHGELWRYSQTADGRFIATDVTVCDRQFDVAEKSNRLMSVSHPVDALSCTGDIQHYPAGTELTIIGVASDGQHYVSACSACLRTMVELTSKQRAEP